MAITIKDIAREAEVSHTTVSRALRDHPAIAPQTIFRIKKLAEELGYVPNTVARGLKTRRSGILGVIVRRIVDPFFGEVLQGIEDVLQAQGHSLFLAASHRDPERMKAIVRTMSQQRVDGVIICSAQVSEQHQQQLARFGVPTVLINNQAADDVAYSVYHDDAFGSQEITRHLIGLGHQRIAYLGNENAGRTSEDRLHGFRQALAEAQLVSPPEYIVNGPNGRADGGATGSARLLLLEKRPTALVCYNDMMAIGAMQTLIQAGLQVPQDFSVTGFDNIELAAYMDPPLTTFNQPKYELGRQAARMMLRLLNREVGDLHESSIVVLRGNLAVRQSTAPPPSQTAVAGRSLTDSRGV